MDASKIERIILESLPDHCSTRVIVAAGYAAETIAAEFAALQAQAEALAGALGKLAKSNIKLNDAGDVFCSECSNRYDDPPHLESCPFAALDAWRGGESEEQNE